LSKSESGDKGFEEWQEARAILARYDNNLHDLRKYGFGLVTALLAANGLLSQGGTSVLPGVVRAGVIVVTLGLIVVLRLLEAHYRGFQGAASMRAKLIENRLNLDLTNDISLLYDLDFWGRVIQYLYYGLIFLTVVVAYPILLLRLDLFAWVVLAGFWAALFVRFLGKDRPKPLIDWSVDRKIASIGTPVRITFTNLSVPRKFTIGWTISSLTKGIDHKDEDEAPDVLLGYLESYDWLWQTEGTEPKKGPNAGLYELKPWVQGDKKLASLLKQEKPRVSSPRIIIQLTPQVHDSATALVRLRIEKADGKD
jgi:hypothetical protein